MVKKKTTEDKAKSEVKSEVKAASKSPKQSVSAKAEQPKQSVSTKSESSKPSTSTETPKQSCSCMTCCATTAVIVAVICCAASYFVCEKNRQNYANVIEQKINASGHASNEELAALKTTIANLKKDVDECKTVKQVQYNNSKLRTKWKAWTAFVDKMNAGEAFDAELKRVKEVFADDAELLKKIDDLLSDAEKNADVIPENIRKYVDKFVTLKRADSKKVAEVTGYVLSSPCNGE